MTIPLAAAPAQPWPVTLLSMVEQRSGLEPWSNHIRLRTLEMDLVREALGDRHVRRLLEIGCGNGFGSAYLADLADEVVATDLPSIDVSTHSIGLSLTRDLYETTGVSNAHLVGCSGEQLPVADGSVDLVLGLYSLEHVPDKDACIAEVARVLDSGGRAAFTIPATAWSVLYPAAVYGGLARRLLRPATAGAAGGSDHVAPIVATPTAPAATAWQRFRRSYPRFPIPEPHGAFPSYFAELGSQRPSQWRAMFERNGLRVTAVRPMAVLPHLLLSSLFGDPGFRLYLRLLWLDRLLCRLPGVWRAAQFVLVQAEKP
jgi:ubiquinone/menaquinone biosynthesis C-methylase UbiE